MSDEKLGISGPKRKKEGPLTVGSWDLIGIYKFLFMGIASELYFLRPLVTGEVSSLARG